MSDRPCPHTIDNECIDMGASRTSRFLMYIMSAFVPEERAAPCLKAAWNSSTLLRCVDAEQVIMLEFHSLQLSCGGLRNELSARTQEGRSLRTELLASRAILDGMRRNAATAKAEVQTAQAAAAKHVLEVAAANEVGDFCDSTHRYIVYCRPLDSLRTGGSASCCRRHRCSHVVCNQ